MSKLKYVVPFIVLTFLFTSIPASPGFAQAVIEPGFDLFEGGPDLDFDDLSGPDGLLDTVVTRKDAGQPSGEGTVDTEIVSLSLTGDAPVIVVPDPPADPLCLLCEHLLDEINFKIDLQNEYKNDLADVENKMDAKGKELDKAKTDLQKAKDAKQRFDNPQSWAESEGRRTDSSDLEVMRHHSQGLWNDYKAGKLTAQELSDAWAEGMTDAERDAAKKKHSDQLQKDIDNAQKNVDGLTNEYNKLAAQKANLEAKIKDCDKTLQELFDAYFDCINQCLQIDIADILEDIEGLMGPPVVLPEPEEEKPWWERWFGGDDEEEYDLDLGQGGGGAQPGIDLPSGDPDFELPEDGPVVLPPFDDSGQEAPPIPLNPFCILCEHLLDEYALKLGLQNEYKEDLGDVNNKLNAKNNEIGKANADLEKAKKAKERFDNPQSWAESEGRRTDSSDLEVMRAHSRALWGEYRAGRMTAQELSDAWGRGMTDAERDAAKKKRSDELQKDIDNAQANVDKLNGEKAKLEAEKANLEAKIADCDKVLDEIWQAYLDCINQCLLVVPDDEGTLGDFADTFDDEIFIDGFESGPQDSWATDDKEDEKEDDQEPETGGFVCRVFGLGCPEPRSSLDDRLVVSNIGSSGEDGVSIDLDITDDFGNTLEELTEKDCQKPSFLYPVAQAGSDGCNCAEGEECVNVKSGGVAYGCYACLKPGEKFVPDKEQPGFFCGTFGILCPPIEEGSVSSAENYGDNFDGGPGGVIELDGELDVTGGSDKLEMDGDRLVVSNIGSSGEDGVSIDLGEGDGRDIFDLPEMEDMPEVDLGLGGNFTLTVSGNVNSCPIGTVPFPMNTINVHKVCKCPAGKECGVVGRSDDGLMECYKCVKKQEDDVGFFCGTLGIFCPPDPDSLDDGLVVSNIGSSGEDGVAIDLGDSLTDLPFVGDTTTTTLPIGDSFLEDEQPGFFCNTFGIFCPEAPILTVGGADDVVDEQGSGGESAGGGFLCNTLGIFCPEQQPLNLAGALDCFGGSARDDCLPLDSTGDGLVDMNDLSNFQPILQGPNGLNIPLQINGMDGQDDLSLGDLSNFNDCLVGGGQGEACNGLSFDPPPQLGQLPVDGLLDLNGGNFGLGLQNGVNVPLQQPIPPGFFGTDSIGFDPQLDPLAPGPSLADGDGDIGGLPPIPPDFFGPGSLDAPIQTFDPGGGLIPDPPPLDPTPDGLQNFGSQIRIRLQGIKLRPCEKLRVTIVRIRIGNRVRVIVRVQKIFDPSLCPPDDIIDGVPGDRTMILEDDPIDGIPDAETSRINVQPINDPPVVSIPGDDVIIPGSDGDGDIFDGVPDATTSILTDPFDEPQPQCPSWAHFSKFVCERSCEAGECKGQTMQNGAFCFTCVPDNLRDTTPPPQPPPPPPKEECDIGTEEYSSCNRACDGNCVKAYTRNNGEKCYVCQPNRTPPPPPPPPPPEDDEQDDIISTPPAAPPPPQDDAPPPPPPPPPKTCEEHCSENGYPKVGIDWSNHIQNILNQHQCVSGASIGISKATIGDCTCSQEPQVNIDHTVPVCQGTPCGDVPCNGSTSCPGPEPNSTITVTCNWGGWKKIDINQFVPQVGG